MPSKYQRKSRVRNPNKKIVVAMEGNKTEPKYFIAVKKKFRSATLEIITLSRAANDTKSAPNHVVCELDNYLKKNKLEKSDELWLVCDKDRWPEKQLNDVARKCQSKGYHLGLSNPCFELWLILHYENVAQLPDVKKIELGQRRNTQKKWGNIYQSKKISGYDQIVDKIYAAIKHAKTLDNKQQSRWPNSLGTNVYHLAESIIKNSTRK